MKLYYCTRFEHNPNKPTEYYIGNGQWAKRDIDRYLILFFENEKMAKLAIQDISEADWHETEINS